MGNPRIFQFWKFDFQTLQFLTDGHNQLCCRVLTAVNIAAATISYYCHPSCCQSTARSSRNFVIDIQSQIMRFPAFNIHLCLQTWVKSQNYPLPTEPRKLELSVKLFAKFQEAIVLFDFILNCAINLLVAPNNLNFIMYLPRLSCTSAACSTYYVWLPPT